MTLRRRWRKIFKLFSQVKRDRFRLMAESLSLIYLMYWHSLARKERRRRGRREGRNERMKEGEKEGREEMLRRR